MRSSRRCSGSFWLVGCVLGLFVPRVSPAASPEDLWGPAWYEIAESEYLQHARTEGGERVWEYDLIVTEERFYLADGTPYKVWAFGGTVPGPLLLAREGERIRIRLINETSNSHTIHSHGLYVPHAMDGVPHAEAHAAAEEMLRQFSRSVAEHENLADQAPESREPTSGARAHMDRMPSWARPVGPGEIRVYEFIARPAGTHFYHCHMNTNEHMDRGMSGPLVVLPREPEPAVDRDVAIILDEWNSDEALSGVPGDPRKNLAYNYFSINGRSFPHTRPLELNLGEVARIRLIHAGAQQHFMHLHGQHFLVTHRDGRPLGEPLMLDTVEIGPGQRVDLLIYGENPGAWPFHCHTTSHVTNAGIYPGGMLTRVLIGDEAMPESSHGADGSGLRSLKKQWKEWAQKESMEPLELGDRRDSGLPGSQ